MQLELNFNLRGLQKVIRVRHAGLMVSALNAGTNGPGSSPGRGHCAMFLGKTNDLSRASFHPGTSCS